MTEEKTGKEEEGKLAQLSTLKYYQRTYAASLSDNDQKAVKVFREYEAQEKMRRLQQELQWVKTGQATEVICDEIIGKRRKAKFNGYDKWAGLMLLWIAALKR